MRKRGIHESDHATKITKYEEERLKRLSFNRERMLEAGFKTCLENKAIFNQRFNVYEKNIEQDSDGSDYQPEPNKEPDSEDEPVFVHKKIHYVLIVNKKNTLIFVGKQRARKQCAQKQYAC